MKYAKVTDKPIPIEVTLFVPHIKEEPQFHSSSDSPGSFLSDIEENNHERALSLQNISRKTKERY